MLQSFGVLLPEYQSVVCESEFQIVDELSYQHGDRTTRCIVQCVLAGGSGREPPNVFVWLCQQFPGHPDLKSHDHRLPCEFECLYFVPPQSQTLEKNVPLLTHGWLDPDLVLTHLYAGSPIHLAADEGKPTILWFPERLVNR